MAIQAFSLKMLQRGLHDFTLVSSGRPSLTLVPAVPVTLTNSAWCSLSPVTSESINGSAKLWYSQYTHLKGILIFGLVEAEDPWHWPHSGVRHAVLRQHTREYKGQQLQEDTFVLQTELDPFSDEAVLEPVLVRRTLLLQAFRKVQIIVEYREPVQVGTLPLADDLPLLAAFEQRARESFSLLIKDEGDVIPTDIRPLEKAPPGLSRQKLARWVGELYRQGNL